jgi:hypothetical protein
MEIKVDVVINVYGKPWQTLCTLKSLMKHSSTHIDKIYLIKETSQPYGDSIDWIFSELDNLIVYEPDSYICLHTNQNFNDINYRKNIRYQYGFDNSDKKYIFITHNDVLYTGDIIGDMLNNIGESIGIGEIGQCWNCPAKANNLCSGEKFNLWNPTYDEVMSLNLPHIRTNRQNIDKNNPKPLPECRLNEWSCLINRELSNNETYPNGNTAPFGSVGLDTGTLWFKSLHLKGYKFVDYRKNFTHSYWSEIGNGWGALFNHDIYKVSEENAKKYYKENYK